MIGKISPFILGPMNKFVATAFTCGDSSGGANELTHVKQGTTRSGSDRLKGVFYCRMTSFLQTRSRKA